MPRLQLATAGANTIGEGQAPTRRFLQHPPNTGRFGSCRHMPQNLGLKQRSGLLLKKREESTSGARPFCYIVGTLCDELDRCTQLPPSVRLLSPTRRPPPHHRTTTCDATEKSRSLLGFMVACEVKPACDKRFRFLGGLLSGVGPLVLGEFSGRTSRTPE